MARQAELGRTKRIARDRATVNTPRQPEAAVERKYVSDTGMYTVSQLVTPDEAAERLDVEMPKVNGRQLRQRHINMSQVRRWADLMRRGKFFESPEGVVYAPNTAVLDGMHRFLAVVDTGLPQWMRVTYDCPPELFRILNVGNRRTSANIMQIAGERNSLQLASALKLFWCYLEWLRAPEANATWTNWNRLRPENSQLEEILEKHEGMRDVVASYATMATRCNIIPSTFCTFIYVAQTAWSARQGLKTLDRFVNEIDEGVGLQKGTASHTCREWFRRNQKNHDLKDRRERQLLILLQAWNRYARGEECKELRAGDKYRMVRPYQPRGSRDLLELIEADTV